MTYRNVQHCTFIALLLSVMLTGCGSSIPDVPTSTDQQPDICTYASSATDALGEARVILAGADAYDTAQLKHKASQLTALAHDFGQRTVPSGASDLQIWTTGAIVAASQMLDAFVAGRDGQSEAGLHLSLLESATDEVSRIRRERCSVSGLAAAPTTTYLPELVPTATDEPSVTPPPTASRTPVPTPVPGSSFTRDENEYQAKALVALNNMNAAAAKVNEGWQQILDGLLASIDVQADPKWQLAMHAATADWRAARQGLAATEPVGRFAINHALLLSAMDALDEYLALVDDAVDTGTLTKDQRVMVALTRFTNRLGQWQEANRTLLPPDALLLSTPIAATPIPTPTVKATVPKAMPKPRTPIPSGPLTDAERQYDDAVTDLAAKLVGVTSQLQYPSEVDRLRSLIATGRELQPAGRFVSAHPKLLDALSEAEKLGNEPTNSSLSLSLLKKLDIFIRAMTALLP